MSATEGQRIVQSTLKTLQNMRTDEAFDLVYEFISVKASKDEFISNPALSTVLFMIFENLTKF